MFSSPMWDNESQRIGMQKCTPLGYRLRAISDIIGLLSLILLFGASVYLAYQGIIGTFHISQLWPLAIPFLLGAFGRALYAWAWRLAIKRGFKYDYEKREATWLENGQEIRYKYLP